jgi:N,N'-diacetyllegionaminate synthase
MINKSKVYIIAEAGVNHNGDLNIALKLIEEAKKSGADCVKFQTFKAEQIVTKTSPKANYQLEVTDKKETQFDMLKKLELKSSQYDVLIEKCKKLDIDFMSTPYNFEDVDFLDNLGVFGFKVASGQLTELPFLEYVAKKNKLIIISTGMANMSEVFDAVRCIKGSGNNNIIVLQCTTNYPSDIQDANLLAMKNIANACDVSVGYSDHVINNYACYGAVALGAKVIEKHFTLDKSMEGPDHSSSSNPTEFSELVQAIRNIELSLGSGLKVPSKKEKKNIFGMKRSIVLNRDLHKGEIIKTSYISFKRPANGLSPNMLNVIIGKKIKYDMKTDEPLLYSSIDW